MRLALLLVLIAALAMICTTVSAKAAGEWIAAKMEVSSR